MRPLALTLIAMTMFAMTVAGCQPEHISKNPYVWHEKELPFFQKFINAQALPSQVEREKVGTLVNHAYPIEVALFSDGTFYYYLENLGDGTGTWNHRDGQLNLYAERSLFVMRMSVHSISEFDDDVVIHFTDRFGTKYLPLEFEPAPQSAN